MALVVGELAPPGLHKPIQRLQRAPPHCGQQIALKRQVQDAVHVLLCFGGSPKKIQLLDNLSNVGPSTQEEDTWHAPTILKMRSKMLRYRAPVSRNQHVSGLLNPSQNLAVVRALDRRPRLAYGEDINIDI